MHVNFSSYTWRQNSNQIIICHTSGVVTAETNFNCINVSHNKMATCSAERHGTVCCKLLVLPIYKKDFSGDS